MTSAGNISSTIIVNAAGRRSTDAAAMAGVPVPVTAHKRHVMIIAGGVKFDRDSPLVIDMATGWYMKGLFHVCGFSGHGFMHAPAVGRITADLVTSGNTSLIDVAAFSVKRFDNACELHEGYTF